MKKIIVRLKKRSYSVLIGRNLVQSAGRFLKPLKLGSKVFVITNKVVGARYLSSVIRSLQKSGYQTASFLLPNGNERDKSAAVLNRIWEKMAQIPLDRSSAVIALGGGVVGDVAGFAAATYMRGISFVQIPTTLLAQVDSAIGGKTAIDLPAAKNVVGAFYQPRIVLSDIDTLASLPEAEFKNSLAEVIKCGVIQDPKLFHLLEQKMGHFLTARRIGKFGSAEYSFLETIITRSAQVKADVVAKDERETKGLRMILNYGHTFAHALEGASKFKIPHGQAVAIGMIFAGELACRLGIFSLKDQLRQIKLIQKTGLRLKYGFSASQLLDFMKRDKKVRSGRLRFVLPIKIGRVQVFDQISESLVRQVLESKRKQA